MSQPEISRRCLSCGASVRAAARFCPQCGALMKDGSQSPVTENQTNDAAPGLGAVAEAPSRREVVSAFETWREEARPTTPMTAAGEEKVENEVSPAPSVAEEPARRAEPARESARESAGEAAAAPFDMAARREGVDEGVGVSNVSAASARGAGVTEAARRRRAGAVVKENIMPRVERMRDEALVVLEETPDDAGLRFVAVAVVLFLLFLLFLFLSAVLK